MSDLDTQIEQITEELAQYWHPRNTAINRANKSLIEAQAAIKNLIAQEVKAARIEERKLVSELMNIVFAAKLQALQEEGK